MRTFNKLAAATVKVLTAFVTPTLSRFFGYITQYYVRHANSDTIFAKYNVHQVCKKVLKMKEI